jgi:hypothetical protein
MKKEICDVSTQILERHIATYEALRSHLDLHEETFLYSNLSEPLEFDKKGYGRWSFNVAEMKVELARRWIFK